MTARIQGASGKLQASVHMRKATGMTVTVRKALWLVLAMLGLSLLLVVLGTYTTTITESVTVSGYASGVIMTLGCFLGLLGLLLEENRKQLLTSAIVFLSLGIVASFFCFLIDGVCIGLNMDMRSLKAGRCQYYRSGDGYIYESFFTSVSCLTLKESCTMTVRSGTCYCCDLYDCANGGYLSNYYEFAGVQSCEDVFTLYVLTWFLASLNLVAFFMGILTTAVLGSIKSERSKPTTEPAESRASTPSAPLLSDVNTHSAELLHPGASASFPPAEKAVGTQSFPLSVTPTAESSPSPFTPHSSSMFYRLNGLSA